MYLYWFTTFAGIDKVMKVPEECLSNFPYLPGDLLSQDQNYFLVLGDEVKFTEQYTTFFSQTAVLKDMYHKFLSQKALQLLHWMVGEYYTTYKNVIKYFVSSDLDTLLQKETKKNTKKSVSSQAFHYWFFPSFAVQGQVLIIFPDVWTMFMMADESFRWRKDAVILHSAETQNKKDKAFWDIKKWNVKYILTTHAEIFQDFADLKQILMVDPHKRYYANQQDPRYKTGDVLQKISEIWKCDIKMIGV